MTKVQKKYYLPPALTQAVAFMALCEGISQSAWADRAIRRFLKTKGKLQERKAQG